MTVQTTTPAVPTVFDPPALPEVTGGHAGGLAVLSDWLTAADAASQLARQLVSSFFVPQAFKPNIPPRAEQHEIDAAVGTAVANATGAILLGQSLGLDPLTSLQQIYVVHGRPGMYAKIKVALAQARGHRVWDEEYGPDAVTVAGQRKGTDDVVRIRITIDDAKRAGWTDNKAYQKTPADMLWARAASRVVDRIAADVLFGIASIEDIEPADEPAPVAARVTIDDVRGPVEQRLAVRAAEDAADAADAAASGRLPQRVADAAAVDAETAAASVLVDERTMNGINSEFVRLGVTGPGVRGRRRRAVERIVDHGVATARELTQVEADLVLDVLKGLQRGHEQLAALLAEEGQPVAEQAAATAPVVDEDPYGGADPDADTEYDPTADADWPQDGGQDA